MTVFFSTTPSPSFQKEGTTGRQPAVGHKAFVPFLPFHSPFLPFKPFKK